MKFDSLNLLVASQDFEAHKTVIADHTALAIKESITLNPDSEFAQKTKQLSGVDKVEAVQILFN